jgi:hypothetical protein
MKVMKGSLPPIYAYARDRYTYTMYVSIPTAHYLITFWLLCIVFLPIPSKDCGVMTPSLFDITRHYLK